MKNKEQRIAIAEACGWTEIKHNPTTDLWYGTPPKDHKPVWDVILPNYLNDLNAMHEAEKMLDGNQQINFACYLTQPVRDEIYEVMPNDLRYTVCYPALHSTAAQRAEAFLRTLNLWKP